MHGDVSVTDALSAVIAYLMKENKELEERVAYLEKQLEELKNGES